MHESEGSFMLFWERCGGLDFAAGSLPVELKSSATALQWALGSIRLIYRFAKGSTVSCHYRHLIHSDSPSHSLSIPAMQRAPFTEEEVRLATERRLKYLGAAKISIYQIQFDPPLPRGLDRKNLDRLCEIFRKNHYRRLDVDNHIPAIVSRQDLATALRKKNIPQRSLLTNNPHQSPQLEFATGHLRALHGRHRVQAGAEVLPPADRWWMVDLYLDGMSRRIVFSV